MVWDAREALATERRTTLQRLADLTGDYDGIVAAAADSNLDDEHDPEGSTIAFERSQVGAHIDQAQEHLEAVEAALARVRAGTYGICERCGGPIPEERLEARPTASTCVRCAAR